MNETLLRANPGHADPGPATPRPAGNSVADVADLLLYRARDRLRRGEWNGAVVLLEVCIDIVESVDDEGLERLAEAG